MDKIIHRVYALLFIIADRKRAVILVSVKERP